MLYHNVRIMWHSLRFIDPAAAVGAAAFLTWYGYGGSHPPPEDFRSALQFFAVSFVIIFTVLAERLRLYVARRTESIVRELFDVAEVGLYACCIAAALTEMWGGGLPSYSYIQALAAVLFVLPTLRLAMRFTIRRLRRRGDDYRRWLLVGHNERSVDLARTILANPHFGVVIEEIVDLASEEASASADWRKFAADPPAGMRLSVVEGVEQIHAIMAERVIDEVVVTLPVRSQYDTVNRILEMCCSAGISVRVRPQTFDILGFATELSHVGKIPMLTHYNGPSNYPQLVLKRVIDVAGAFAGLVVLAPVFAAIAAAIKLDSRGPVFFRQTRVGLHGRHFELVKFRSMVKDASAQREELAADNQRDGTAFKIRNDARITAMGRWLRRYHLDEFPQLWNVLVGDMSLVGPRPLPVKEAHGNEWWQRRRLSMPPGLTCIWQVEDDPQIPFHEWMALDMDYIDRWSIWLDLKLIALTFQTVLRGKGW
ncbi:MAG TPA: sugar transferase [Usitatibacter sp.]|nr:sugar transferase [Usitatibacter sp.]